MALLSVVVPFHDVEDLIGACLESLARQTLRDLEVVLVDDGSTDGTARVARDFAASDPRFRVVTQENRGPGPARNRGVESATGRYLAFADADDLVHRRGYQRLVDSLEETGSELAVGRAARFNKYGVTPSYVHERAILGAASGTHLRARPELVLDRMVWNKVFRRSFWDHEGFAFAPMLMQDYPVSVAAHAKARRVDVLDDVVYFWRERDGGPPSITQRARDLDSIRDRFASAWSVLDLVEGTTPQALLEVRRHLLEVDLTALVAGILERTPEAGAPGNADRDEALALARRLADRLVEGPPTQVPLAVQRQSELVRAGDVDALQALAQYRARHGDTGPVARGGIVRRRYVVAIPGTGRRRTALPAPPGVLARVEDAAWDDDVLTLRLVADVPFRLAPEAEFAVSWTTQAGTDLVAPTEARWRPLASGTVELATQLDLAELAGAGRGFVRLWLAVDAPGFRWSGPVGQVSLGRGRFVASREVPGSGLLVQPMHRPGTGFGLRVGRPTVVGSTCDREGEGLAVTGIVHGPEAMGTATLVVAVPGNPAPPSFPVSFGPWVDGRQEFRAHLDAVALAADPDLLSPIAAQERTPLRLVTASRAWPLAPGPQFVGATAVVGHRSVAVQRSPRGRLEVVEQRLAPEIFAIEWCGPETLRVSGTWHGRQPLPTSLELVQRVGPGSREPALRVLAPLVATGGAGFDADLDVTELIRAQSAARIPGGLVDKVPWSLVIPFEDHVGPAVHCPDALAGFAAPRLVADALISVAAGSHGTIGVRVLR